MYYHHTRLPCVVDLGGRTSTHSGCLCKLLYDGEMKNIEIEQKYKVEDITPLVALLEREGKYLGTEHQIDEYFNAPHRDFLAMGPQDGDDGPSKIVEWLRLRDADGAASLNYKYWHKDEQHIAHHCDEYESKVDDIDQVRRILLALNFTSMVIVDKSRRAWNYKEYEVSIDTVQGIGEFVELEYKGNDLNPDPKVIAGEMKSFLEGLHCGAVNDQRGYPFHLLFIKK